MDRAFTILAALFGLFALLMLGGVLYGLFRLAQRFIDGWLDGLNRLVDGNARDHAALLSDSQKTRHSVHAMHQAWLGAPERIPGPHQSVDDNPFSGRSSMKTTKPPEGG